MAINTSKHNRFIRCPLAEPWWHATVNTSSVKESQKPNRLTLEGALTSTDHPSKPSQGREVCCKGVSGGRSTAGPVLILRARQGTQKGIILKARCILRRISGCLFRFSYKFVVFMLQVNKHFLALNLGNQMTALAGKCFKFTLSYSTSLPQFPLPPLLPPPPTSHLP